jgi:hypothetical protein
MTLNFQVQKQILPNWCWAAVSSSVSFFFNQNQKGYYQAQLAAQIIDPSCSVVNNQNAGAAPPICNTPKDIATALQFTRNYAGEMARALSLNEIVAQINGGFPICCQILWANLQQSHFVTIYGYQGTQLQIGDPEAGLFYVDYNSFLYYRGGVWRRTIGTQQVPALTS